MEKKLTWQEVEERFDREWVQLVDYDWPEDEPLPRSGVVVVHAKARHDFDAMIARAPQENSALVYVGERQIPPGVVLSANLHQMFNSFLDETKSAIEMAAVANATGLTPSPEGLSFPPCGADELPQVLKPRSAGGVLHHAGQVEVVSSLTRDGREVPRDLRWGVYVTFAANSAYVRRCFREYGVVTDESGDYAGMYRPYHLIGLELGISVAAVGLRREPTGAPTEFRGDVVATAKRDLKPGEVLDGEGGSTVYGRLMPAANSLALEGLPIGLAHGVELTRSVAKHQPLTWRDVTTIRSEAAHFRREMEAVFSKESGLRKGTRVRQRVTERHSLTPVGPETQNRRQRPVWPRVATHRPDRTTPVYSCNSGDNPQDMTTPEASLPLVTHAMAHADRIAVAAPEGTFRYRDLLGPRPPSQPGCWPGRRTCARPGSPS